MSYTSGRSVKTSRKVKPTTVGSATADARKVVRQIWPTAPWNVGVTIDSARTAVGAQLTPAVRTTVTFPADNPGRHDLALTLYGLPGVVAAASTPESVTITRTV